MVVGIEQQPGLRDYNHPAYSNLKLLKDRFESAGILSGSNRYLGVR